MRDLPGSGVETPVPCTGRQTLHHGPTGEIPPSSMFYQALRGLQCSSGLTQYMPGTGLSAAVIEVNLTVLALDSREDKGRKAILSV